MDYLVKHCVVRDSLVDDFFSAIQALLNVKNHRKPLLTDHSSRTADARLCLAYCSVNEHELVANVVNAGRSNVIDGLPTD
jgi:hypothetical protein